MTDRERLLVALLSEGGDEFRGRMTSIEIVAMLHELGAEYRRAPAGSASARV